MKTIDEVLQQIAEEAASELELETVIKSANVPIARALIAAELAPLKAVLATGTQWNIYHLCPCGICEALRQALAELTEERPQR